jgi:hypothetical protein
LPTCSVIFGEAHRLNLLNGVERPRGTSRGILIVGAHDNPILLPSLILHSREFRPRQLTAIAEITQPGYMRESWDSPGIPAESSAMPMTTSFVPPLS